MSIVQRWATSLADWMHPEETDAALIDAGWQVEQLADGSRRVGQIMVSWHTAARRARIARGDGDELDAMFAGTDRAPDVAGVLT
jgi:hypothetical protein